MFIYQGDMYIDRLENVGTYNTATAEQTEEDEKVFVEQRKKISHFNKYVDEHAIARVGITERDTEPVEAGEVNVLAQETAEPEMPADNTTFVHNADARGREAV